MSTDAGPPRAPSTERARWQRAQELFHAAAELPSRDQRAFLQSSCGGDQDLVAEVMALLSEDTGGPSLLERGVADMARDLFAAGTLGPIAKQLGPYRIKKRLGAGGMGVVFLAERIDLGSLVAIKLLSSAGELSSARVERFAAEQRMLAQLDHPAIARLYDAGALDDDTPFFVMEYVDGKPLTEHCSAHSATIEERLGLFRSLCEAVQFAHQHAIIHRDIKPTNVLVKQDGSVRLLDFGIAKHLENLDASAHRTHTGLRLMTPAYAAPEQLRGDPVGIYTDVYALGVVLYELLTGRLPFDRSPRSGERDRVVVETVPDKPSVAARASSAGAAASRAAWADLDVLVLSAMHGEPQRRYRSVEALIRDIDHYLHGEPLEARPDRFGYRLRKFLTRNWRSVALAATTLAVVVGLVGFFTARLATARDAAVAQAGRVQGLQRFMVDLLTGGDQEDGPDKDLRVVAVLERGAKEARALDRDPDTQAALFVTLGRMFEARGELDRADALFRSALDLRTAFAGEDSVAAMEPMWALGALRVEQARYDEAEKLLRTALDIGRRELSPSDERILDAAESLGALLTVVGRLPEAITVLDEVVRVELAATPRRRGVSTTMTVLAVTQYNLGHYAEADEMNRRALAIARQDYGDRHPNVAENLYNLAAIQLQWGHPDQAETYYRDALAIIQGYYDRDSVQTAEALTMLSRALVPLRKFDEDAANLARSLTIRERAFGKVHPKIASTLSDLAAVALGQGRLDEAEAHYRRAEAIYREVMPGSYLVALAHGNIGRVYVERKDYPTAERLFTESLAMYRKALPADHSLLAEAEIRVGRVLVLQKRYAEAEPHTLAGYTVLARAGGDSRWLVDARSDLTTLYEALGQPEKASRFRVP